MNSWPVGGKDDVLEGLQQAYFPAADVIDVAGLLNDPALGRMAVVSSFGAESVVMLHYVVGLLPDVPVLFLDTGKHFAETLEYRDRLAELFNINLRVVRPDEKIVADEDPSGTLHSYDPDGCCTIRKTFPLQDALADYDSWISGRKRYQSSSRATLPLLERDGEKIKINPLALWGRDEIIDYFTRHDLPPHPLEKEGYKSIGCSVCTRPVAPGEDARAGRWSDTPGKSECGIHLGPDGRFIRSGRHRGEGQ